MLNFLNLYPKNNFYNFKEEYFFFKLKLQFNAKFFKFMP